jgi:hypothetical protein
MDDNRHSWDIIPDVLVAIEKEGNSSARRISYGRWGGRPPRRHSRTIFILYPLAGRDRRANCASKIPSSSSQLKRRFTCLTRLATVNSESLPAVVYGPTDLVGHDVTGPSWSSIRLSSSVPLTTRARRSVVAPCQWSARSRSPWSTQAERQMGLILTGILVVGGSQLLRKIIEAGQPADLVPHKSLDVDA